jgi:hypothetical protein
VAFGKVPQEGSGIEEKVFPNLTGCGIEVSAINKDLHRFFLELFEQMGLEAYGFPITMGEPQDHGPGMPRDRNRKLGSHDGILGVAANRFDRRNLFELFQNLHLAYRARVQDPIHALEGFFEPQQLGRGQQGFCVRQNPVDQAKSPFLTSLEGHLTLSNLFKTIYHRGH